MTPTRIVLAVTGASGMPYAVRLARFLAAAPAIELHCIVSDAARRVLELESDVTAEALAALAHRCYGPREWDAPRPAAPGVTTAWWCARAPWLSPPSPMAWAPISSTGRPTPPPQGGAQAGARAPGDAPFRHPSGQHAGRAPGRGRDPAPLPGLYHRPASIDDLVDFVVARVLTALGIEQQLVTGWKEEEAS